MRLRYSSVNAAIAASFVFPIHAILIFTAESVSHFVPEASTTDAPKTTFSLSEYRRTAACTSAWISAHVSAGTRSSIGRNGTETDCEYSHNSSTGPSHVHGSVLVSSSTPLNPALRNTADRLPRSANRKGFGASGGSKSPPTCRCTTPIMLRQYG